MRRHKGLPARPLQGGPIVAPSDLPPDALFRDQTNLYAGDAEMLPGVDINVVPVWKMGFTGKGVSIGLYDTALDIHHPDLAKNIDMSLRVVAPNGGYVDPTRIAATGDEHATSVAGIIAAARNGIGVVGVAYDAKITPVDIFDGSESYYRAALAAQGRFDITNHSWGYGGAFVANPLVSAESAELHGFAAAAGSGRGGLGTLENVAAGNYRQYGMGTETNGLTTDRHVVVVGAIDRTGTVASYSNPGASLLVVAPSSGDDSGFTTTDVRGSKGYSPTAYTDGFGGTSASTPQLSGIEADMLQANPHLGWRDVQTILAVAARHSGSAIGGEAAGFESEAWTVNHAANWNGGGMHFSNDYGFGLIDARAAVMLALSWSQAMPAPETSKNEVAAAGSAAGSWHIGGGAVQTIAIDIERHEAVEAMVLDLRDLAMKAANHLFVDLVSPTGTISHLLVGNGADGDQIGHGWRLMSRAFRGEDSHGTWTVRITTSDATDSGRLAHLSLTAYGAPTVAAAVHFYTDEFAGLWDETRAVLHDPARPVTIDAAPVTGDVCLDLAGGTGSIGGASLTVAADTHVRTVISGSGDDSILGSGALRVFAAAGSDTIVGGAGRDNLHGDGGADTIEGGAGADRLFGGGGRDTLSFAHARHGVHVLLADAHPQETGQGRDTIAGFESIAGSDFADRLVGDARANRIDGAAGNDLLIGGAGRDILDGGPGADWLRGGSGGDTFVLAGPDDPRDLVFDFSHVAQADKVRIDRAAFDIAASVHVGGNGATDFAGYFVQGTAATGDHGQFVYDHATGGLFFDDDGAAADGAVLIATFLNHPALRAADFDLV